MQPYERYIQHKLTTPIRLKSPLLLFSLLLLGSLAFAFGGLWILSESEEVLEQVAGIICILFFGGLGLLILPPFLTSSYIAEFDNTGFYTQRYKIKIPWSEIKAVGIMETKGRESLGIAVNDYEKYRDKIPWGASFMRSMYRTFMGRAISITIIAALDTSEVKEALKTVSEAKDFDFWWSHYEFPSMTMKEVKDIIEKESQARLKK